MFYYKIIKNLKYNSMNCKILNKDNILSDKKTLFNDESYSDLNFLYFFLLKKLINVNKIAHEQK